MSSLPRPLSYVLAPWQQAFDFTGVTTRGEYWAYLVPHVLVSVGLFYAFNWANTANSVALLIVTGLAFLLLQWVLLPLSARRLRDSFLPPELLFLLLIPWVGALALAFPLLLRATRRPALLLPDGTIIPAVGPSGFLKRSLLFAAVIVGGAGLLMAESAQARAAEVRKSSTRYKSAGTVLNKNQSILVGRASYTRKDGTFVKAGSHNYRF